MRCTPSTVSITALLCGLSRVAIESSRLFSLAPRESSLRIVRLTLFWRIADILSIAERADSYTALSAFDHSKLNSFSTIVSLLATG